jgi:hypothetical protein
MADFALWATACEQAFWKEGTFWAAYSDNLEEVVNTVIEADLVGAAVRQLAMERESWEGTSLGLLSALRGIVDDEGTTRSKDWPNSPEGLSNPLRRAATFLRKAGVEVSFRREGKQRTRMITIVAARKKADGEPSVPSALSARSAETNDYNDLQADGLGAVTHPADSSTVRRHPNRPPTVRLNPLKNEAADAADGSDGQRPPISGGQTRI